MPRLHWLIRGLWSTVRQSRTERELQDELAFHLESRTADLIKRGLSADEASRRARREFGAIEVYKEHVRDVQRFRVADDTCQDLRYAIRTLKRNPGFATVAIVSLALGIGANTGIFSLLDAVILKSLPVPDPQELFVLQVNEQGGDARRFSHGAFRSLDDALPGKPSRSVAALKNLAAMTPVGRVMTVVSGSELSEATRVQLVSSDYFSTLGISPHLGRALTADDDNDPSDGAAVPVISYGFWQRRLAASGSVLHRQLKVNGYPLTIVGVTPREFSGAPRWTYGCRCRFSTWCTTAKTSAPAAHSIWIGPGPASPRFAGSTSSREPTRMSARSSRRRWT